jgi:hypothetical protein
MKGIVPALIAASLLSLVADASAQDFTRRHFAFFERQLAIEVVGPASGTLHIVRGMHGRLEVHGRSDAGFAGIGLTGQTRDHLQLAPVGAGQAEFMVVVPEHVRVRVRLPEGVMDVPTTEPATSVQFGAAAGRNGSNGLMPYPPPSSGAGPYPPMLNGGGTYPPAANGAGPYPPAAYGALPYDLGSASDFGSYAPATPVALPLGTTLAYHVAADAAPSLLTLLGDEAIRRVDVRIGGDDFSIITSRHLALRAGDAAHLELRLGTEPIDLMVHVPRGALLDIRTTAGPLLKVRGGKGETTCDGVTVQRRRGAERYTFATADGAPLCR